MQWNCQFAIYLWVQWQSSFGVCRARNREVKSMVEEVLWNPPGGRQNVVASKFLCNFVRYLD